MIRTRPAFRAALLVMVVAVEATSCGSSGGGTARGGSSRGSKAVSVLYAGSLVDLMENQIGPAFTKATGIHYSGFGAGSSEVASDIASRAKTGDVFISASPTADQALQGLKRGDWVRWWSTFATAPLVVAYSPHSRFASDFRTKPWYDVITEPGIRLGRTDPKLDPKGELTVAALQDAERLYHLHGFAAKVESGSQVFPEEELLGRLSAGQLDAGFFYTNETAPSHLPSVTLGRVRAAATFTVTVLEHAPQPAAGVSFVRYLLTTARSALSRGGLHLQPPALAGDRSAVPSLLRPLVGG